MFVDYLELGRLPGQEHLDLSIRYLTQKYSQAPPDVVLTLGRAAIPFLLKNKQVVGPNVPIIVANAPLTEVPDKDQLPNSIYVGSQYNFLETLKLAQRLQPNARNLVVVGGAGQYAKQWLDDARRQLEPYADMYSTRYISEIGYQQLLNEIAQLPKDTIVILSVFILDGDGNSRPTLEVATDLAGVTTAPIYSPLPSSIGTGIVGGYSDDWRTQGKTAAAITLQLLAGKQISELPRLNFGEHKNRIDARELKHWQLSESAVPADAEIRFREFTLWEQYRWAILATLTLLLLEAGVIAWLVIERRRRLAAEWELRQRLLQVIHLNRTAAAGALSASVAHELNQPLGAIRSYAEAAALYLKADPPNLEKIGPIIEQIIRDDQRAADIIRHIRELVKGRSSSEVEEFDLNEVVRDVVEIVRPESTKSGLKLDLVLAGGPLTVRGDRIQVQQAIINLALNAIDAMRETPAAVAGLSISTARSNDGAAELSVVDSGRGIPADKLNTVFETFYTTKRHGTGLGLTVARTIVESYGGRIWAENHSGGGAEFRFNLPLSSKS
ncbi:ATP-binding protein [Bradyrhizobium sp. CB2312]|uniref:ATP-binding protein n=1 Tax=Bradyrhizobium sp. CB2312 TaxID=3039155 RepID=UPI0024B0AD42|nr:ATP-binding protein [Bradyrhizobium sp. CB2312]WFU75524.1 ATP-binding protein [Bradyrhizobium sp. CB2312]